MKHPFWIANSTLFFLILLVLLFIYFSRVLLPERENIQPTVSAGPAKREVLTTINITKIYEQDLFDTYREEIKVRQQELSIPLPKPPIPQIISIPKIPAPKFVDPLNITLKGIIFIGAHETKNRAIIEDNQTRKESIYKVSDKVEDAQLIRIFSNKVLFLRANGQQEVLYLREQDAKLDPIYANINGWKGVVQEVSENSYEINQYELKRRIKNLGQFIDMLGLISAYKQGKSIGCRVGELMKNSIGQSLGFKNGDIILTINKIPTATTTDRLKIYKHIISIKENDSIDVKIIRHDQKITITYTLKEFKDTMKKDVTEEELRKIIIKRRDEKKKKIMKQKNGFALPLQEIRNREKQHMLEKGRVPRKYKG